MAGLNEMQMSYETSSTVRNRGGASIINFSNVLRNLQLQRNSTDFAGGWVYWMEWKLIDCHDFVKLLYFSLGYRYIFWKGFKQSFGAKYSVALNKIQELFFPCPGKSTKSEPESGSFSFCSIIWTRQSFKNRLLWSWLLDSNSFTFESFFNMRSSINFQIFTWVFTQFH